MRCCRACHRNLHHCGKCMRAYSVSLEGWAILSVGVCISFLQMQQFCPQGMCCDIFHTKCILLLAPSVWLCFSDFLLMSSVHSCYCMFLQVCGLVIQTIIELSSFISRAFILLWFCCVASNRHCFFKVEVRVSEESFSQDLDLKLPTEI